MALLSKLLRSVTNQNQVWNMALHSISGEFEIDKKLPSPKIIFSSRNRRMNLHHIHTRADPFLFPTSDGLFIFYEAVEIDGRGRIEALKTRDMVTFLNMGTILELPCHLSYPAVFIQDEAVYMIPESSRGNEVVLFKFRDFPYGLERMKTILRGEYADSSPLYYQGMWYLFTTSNRGLEIFFTEDISRGPYSPHPNNPITTDPRFSRSGGLPIVLNGQLYRIAQDCSVTYGGNLNILRVLELSPSGYREELAREAFFECDQPWNSEGGHHLSVARFKGQTVVATDGKQADYRANRLVSPVFRTIRRYGLQS
jgi:hypothetical protein